MTKLMYEFAENVEILANRATMLKLSDPSLAQKSAKLDSDLKRIANKKIDNINSFTNFMKSYSRNNKKNYTF